MLNNVVIVGKLHKVPIKNKSKYDNELIIEVQRSYLNVDGFYDVDYFKCVLWDGISKNLIDYCKVGDIVTIKGRLESEFSKNEVVEVISMRIVAERVVFLQKKTSKEDQL